MHHAVIIASLNRPAVLAETLANLRQQTAPPEQVIVSVTKPQDAQGVLDAGGSMPVTVVIGQRGSAVQRNAGLAHVDPGCDIVSFFDDDIELAPDYCQRMRETLGGNPALVAMDGHAIADGSRTGGVSREAARAALAGAGATPAAQVDTVEVLHGCNMNVRRRALDTVRFDEKFAAYGWLEDADFTYQLGRLGQLGSARQCRLVHLGTSSGRSSGLQMGISQIVNPLYLSRKHRNRSLPSVARVFWVPAVAANLLGLLGRGPANIDRLGRLRGNAVGFWHVLRGRIDPEVVLQYR